MECLISAFSQIYVLKKEISEKIVEDPFLMERFSTRKISFLKLWNT